MPIHSFLPNCNSQQSLICFFKKTLSMALPFPKCMYLESNTIYPFKIGPFHLVMWIYGFSFSFHGLIAHFSLVLNNTPPSGCATVLFTHSLTEGHLGCFQVFKIMNKASINNLCGSFCIDI